MNNPVFQRYIRNVPWKMEEHRGKHRQSSRCAANTKRRSVSLRLQFRQLTCYTLSQYHEKSSRNQWPRSLRRVCSRFFAEIEDSNPAGGMVVSDKCCVLSGRGLCVGMITRPEESN